jgi:hypothetical protein
MAIINPKAGTMMNANRACSIAGCSNSDERIGQWALFPSWMHAFGVARDVCSCCLMDKLASAGRNEKIAGIVCIVLDYRTVTHTLKLKGLGCVDVVARFNGRAQFRKEKPRQAGSLLFGFASRKGVREQEAHLLCTYLSPNIKRRSLYALGVRLGWCCKSTTDLLVRMVAETRYISRYLCCFFGRPTAS